MNDQKYIASKTEFYFVLCQKRISKGQGFKQLANLALLICLHNPCCCFGKFV